MRHYIGFICFCLVFKFVFVYFFEILPELVMGAKQIYHLSSDENDPSHIGYNNLRFPLIFFYNILYFWIQKLNFCLCNFNLFARIFPWICNTIVQRLANFKKIVKPWAKQPMCSSEMLLWANFLYSLAIPPNPRVINQFYSQYMWLGNSYGMAGIRQGVEEVVEVG